MKKEKGLMRTEKISYNKTGIETYYMQNLSNNIIQMLLYLKIIKKPYANNVSRKMAQGKGIIEVMAKNAVYKKIKERNIIVSSLSNLGCLLVWNKKDKVWTVLSWSRVFSKRVM